MQRNARYFVAAIGLLVGLSGCPVTDDYYLLPDGLDGQGGEVNKAGAAANGGSMATGAASNGGGALGGKPAAGSGSGGSPSAGAGMGGNIASGGVVDAGGAPDPGQAGMPSGEGGAAGTTSEPCVPTTERCNGHDDDCDESIDEDACLSNCSGFVLASDPEHGYMFCNGARRTNWDNAKKACEDQDMRLAWLTSGAENTAVAQRLDNLGSDAEVLFGATDQGAEGDWIWAGGQQFWDGDEDGDPVGGLYNNWTAGTPNNSNNEDCALLMTATGKWGDRTCTATYPYVCEQPD